MRKIRSVGQRIAGSAFGAALILISCITSEATEPKASPSKAPDAPAQQQGMPAVPIRADIQQLALGEFTPKPLLIGELGTAEFGLDVVFNGPSDAARRHVASMIEGFELFIDGRKVPTNAASISRFRPAQDTPGFYSVVGSVSFHLESNMVSRTWFGLRPADEHFAFLSDRESKTRSNATRIEVTDSAGGRLTYWLGLASPVLLAYAAAGAWWLRRRRRLAEYGGPRVVPSRDAPYVRSGIGLGPSAAAPALGHDSEQVAPAAPPSIPDDLVTALCDGNAVVALGAGASTEAGFPTGPAMLDILLERLGNQMPASLLRALTDGGGGIAKTAYRLGGFGKVMDAILSSVPRERVIAEMGAILGAVDPDPTFHRRCAELPWHGLLALTWDNFAEKVMTAKRSTRTGEWHRFRLDDVSELAATLKSGAPFIMRPLGDLDHPASLSLSIEEFRRNLYRAPEFQRGLGLLLQTHTFLFVGVGVDTLEQFLQAVAPELEVGRPRHYALVPHDRINDVLSVTLARFGVQILPYPALNGHAAVGEFLVALEREVRVQSRGRRPKREKKGELNASRVSGIRLTNIGLFDTLDLKFSTTPIAETQALPWTVIFGPNGCGKSSILRAIGLVFAGNDPSAANAAARLLKTGTQRGEVELTFGPDKLRTLLDADRTQVINRSVQVTPVQAGVALVLGFPSLRGGPSGNPKGPSRLDQRDPEPADLLPMVNGEIDKRLGSFKQWIVNVLEQARDGRNARAVRMRDLLNNIINDLVPGEINGFAPLDASYTIKVTTPEGEVPLDDLSQGMASIFNWVGVLVQRLYDVHPQAEFPEREAAVVLVDEIDAHLHPEWQRKLVELTKKFFPQLQVIATSHSPLLAGALRPEEICVLERHPETGRVAPVPYRINVFGLSSDAILMSPAFRMSTDRNPEIERLIHSYFDLFEKPEKSEADAKKLIDLTKRLRELRYGEIVGSTSAQGGAPVLTEGDIDTLRAHFAKAEASRGTGEVAI